MKFPDPLDTDEAVQAALEAEARERVDAPTTPRTEEEFQALAHRQRTEDAERRAATAAHQEQAQARARALLAEAEALADEGDEPEAVVDVGAIIAQEQAALRLSARRAAAAMNVHTVSSAYDIDPAEAAVLAAQEPG